MATGRPIFPGLDENELLEFFIMMVGIPSQEMVSKAKKRSKFFDKYGKLIRSKSSRLGSMNKKSYPLREALNTKDFLLINFIEVKFYILMYLGLLRNRPRKEIETGIGNRTSMV